MASTPCPRCGKPVPVKGERGMCKACGLAVRFVDAEERPCSKCGKAVAFAPGKDAAQCPACAAWTALDPARPLQARTTCPRCRRRVEVPLEAATAPCPRCGALLELAGHTL